MPQASEGAQHPGESAPPTVASRGLTPGAEGMTARPASIADAAVAVDQAADATSGPDLVGRFAYRAIGPSGHTEVGTIVARGRDAASALLARRGLFPFDIQPWNRRGNARSPDLVREGSSGAEPRVADDARRRLPVRDLALGLRLLGSLLGKGYPLEMALGVFATAAPPTWTPTVIAAIREALREGKSPVSALCESGIEFPPAVLGMVEAGETSGTLADSVTRAATVMEQAAATRAAIRSALTYPAILAAAGSLSVVLLVGVLLPRFAAIVNELGQDLPRSAQFVLATGDLVGVLALPATSALLTGVVAWRYWLVAGGEKAHAAWHGALLAIPVGGAIRRSAASARIANTLAALIASGVPMPRSLVYAASAGGDAALVQRVMRAREQVIAGERLSAAIEAHGALTPTVVQLIRAGEATGDLAGMLDHAARLERELAEERVKAFVQVLEPALIVLFGGIVAVIAASLLQAVYSVRPVV